MKLVIATPFYEMKGFSPYISSLVNTARLLDNLGIEWDFWELSGDSYIDRARNSLAKKFMESHFTDLLMIDSDESWDLKGFANLLKSDADIVGAGYPCKNSWDFYGCVLHTDTEGRPIVNEHGLLAAQIVPAGFLKIRKRAFQLLAEKQPTNCYYAKPSPPEEPIQYFNFFGRIPPLGEDGSFCKRWQDIGGQLWVQPDITITHYGIKGWKGNYHEALQRYPGGAKEGQAYE